MKKKEFTNKYAEQLTDDKKQKYKVVLAFYLLAVVVYLVGFWLLLFQPFHISPWVALAVVTIAYLIFMVTSIAKFFILTDKKKFKA